MSMLSGLWGRGVWSYRSSAIIDREIDDELDFHLACLTQDLIASGMSPGQASDEANRQFGVREKIRRQCQTIDYGHNRWLIVAVSSGFLAMMAVIGWLTTRLNDAQLQNRKILNQLQALQPVKEEKLDLTGEILDLQNAPVSGATVLLIFKSWPNDYFKQEVFNTVSDKDGKFRFPELYSTKTQTAFLVTVLAEKQAMQSEYVVYEPNATVKSFHFQLDPALDKTFVLYGSDGKPLADALVFPGTRKPKKRDDQFLMYDQSGEAAARKTDAKGKIRLPFFETGDTVELQVVDGEQLTLVVDASEEQSVGKPNDASNGRWAPPPVDVDESHVEWVRKNAIPFRLNSDGADDFADLMPMKAMIGESRIVQLGEETHGDGACFQAKVRLIRFLHQEMGFDVLAFESGLYDCHRANASLRSGAPPLQAAHQGVFGIWTGCSEVVPLWTHIAETMTTERPLELVGFDCQFTGEASPEHLVDDLKAIAVKYHVLESEDPDKQEWRAFFKQLQRMTFHEEFKGSKADWLSSIDVLIAGFEKAKSTSDADEQELNFWRQELRSLRAYAQYAISETPKRGVGIDEAKINGRDAQMADNLIWLAKQRYPGRKIIVWAASFHIMRNAAGIEVPDGSVNYATIVPMGHSVHQKLGKDVFTIAFTAAEGEAGVCFGRPFSIDRAPSGTLEDLCARAQLQHGIVPLRTDAPDSAWISSSKIFARPLGYGWMKARWSDHFDAIVFQHTMKPATANR